MCGFAGTLPDRSRPHFGLIASHNPFQRPNSLEQISHLLAVLFQTYLRLLLIADNASRCPVHFLKRVSIPSRIILRQFDRTRCFSIFMLFQISQRRYDLF